MSSRREIESRWEEIAGWVEGFNRGFRVKRVRWAFERDMKLLSIFEKSSTVQEWFKQLSARNVPDLREYWPAGENTLEVVYAMRNAFRTEGPNSQGCAKVTRSVRRWWRWRDSDIREFFLHTLLVLVLESPGLRSLYERDEGFRKWVEAPTSGLIDDFVRSIPAQVLNKLYKGLEKVRQGEIRKDPKVDLCARITYRIERWEMHCTNDADRVALRNAIKNHAVHASPRLATLYAEHEPFRAWVENPTNGTIRRFKNLLTISDLEAFLNTMIQKLNDFLERSP